MGSFTGVPVNHNGEFMRNKGSGAMASTFPLSDALLLLFIYYYFFAELSPSFFFFPIPFEHV